MKSKIGSTKKSFEVPATPTSDGEGSREAWGSPIEFFLSCLGYAVGFGNVWRFPFLAFKNGGAVFLIPYGIMLICGGLPLFFMELVLGQYASLGPTVLFENMAPILSGVGYAMLVISFLITVYYNMLFAWAIFFFFNSFNSVLPWSHCQNDFNSANCYTQDEAMGCVLQNFTYFNRTCQDPEFLCSEAGLFGHNTTHCVSPSSNCTILDDDCELEYSPISRRVSAAEDFFRNRVLGIEGTSWEDMGSMKWEIAGYLALGWAIIALCSIKGVKSSGKVVYFTSTFPYVIMIALFVRGLTLEGYQKGIDFYILKPNVTKLMEVEVWNDAATQIFYSLGSSAGVLITLSSYSKFKNNCLRDAIVIAIANSSTSIFAGFVIFSILGFMAHELGVEVEDVVSSGSGLAFIVYPEAVAKMPLPWLWSLLFFSMLMSLGISSQFSYFETLSSSIYDKFENLRPYKPLIAFLLAFVLWLSGLTMCLQGGAYMIELFVWYSSGISLIALGFIEVCVIQYVFGFRRMMNLIQKEMEIHIPKILYAYWTITWLFVTPASLLVILVFSTYFFVPAYYGDYLFPWNIQALGWLMCFSSLICIPIGAVLAYRRSEDKSWKHLSSPTSDMCPAHLRNVDGNKEKFHYTYQNAAYTEEKY